MKSQTHCQAKQQCNVKHVACYMKKQYPHMGFALYSHYLSGRQQEFFFEYFIHALMTRHVFCNYGCMKLVQGDYMIFSCKWQLEI
jgi:hypothetical protein